MNGYQIVDSCDFVNISCSKCRDQFAHSAPPCWQAGFWQEPLQKLGCSGKMPMRGDEGMWVIIFCFLPWDPPCDFDMPAGVSWNRLVDIISSDSASPVYGVPIQELLLHDQA